MKKLLALFALVVLCGSPAAAFAEQAASVAAPVPNKGDTAWMLVATILVILMSLPGLALFYGGLVRVKNMLSVLAQVFAIFCLISILWVVYGYSLAFTAGGSINDFIGGLSRVFLSGLTPDSTVETFSKGVVIPEMLFMVFQLTFAAITVALTVGGFAERIKFSALLVFAALWFTFSYLPMAHMVWFWGGPSAHSDPVGFIFGKGALDFAGGTVVHINAAMGALMGAVVLGLLAGVVCFWGVTGLKKLLGIDDSLDVFGIHGVGGILGALGTGVLASPSLGGTGVYDYAAGKVAEYSIIGQVASQAWGVGVTILWSGVVSFVLFKLIDKAMGLRVAEEDEREGLDTTSHGERAYSL